MIAAAENSADGFVIIDRLSRIRYMNPAALLILGIGQVTEMADTQYRNMLPESVLHRLEAMRAVVEVEGTWVGEVEITTPAGDRLPLALTVYALVEGATEPGVAIVLRRPVAGPARTPVLTDAMNAVASRKREQAAIAELNRISLTGRFDDLISAAVNVTREVLGVVASLIYQCVPGEEHLRFITGAGSFERDPRLSPLTAEGPTGHAIRTRRVVECPSIDDDMPYSTETMRRFGIGSGVAVPIPRGEDMWGTIAVFRNEAHAWAREEIAFLITISEVIASALRRRDLERELRYQTLHDPLTRLGNRTLAYQRIDDALDQSRRESTMTAVMLIDLHDFRVINDSFGHGAGDSVLVAVAKILDDLIPGTDSVARFGGDEYLVVASSLVDRFDAIALAQNVIAQLKMPIDIGSRVVEISASVGIALGYGENTAAEMVRHADLALAEAKNEGPASHQVFDDVYGDQSRRRLTIATGVRAALDAGTLDMRFQPVYSLDSGQFMAVEALSRFTDPELGPVGPGEFVGIAERSGLIRPLGAWALRRACIDALDWDLDLRVNVSPIQLRHPDFAASVGRILAETGFDARRLGLEITESVWVEDTSTVTRNLAALHDRGVTLVIDDFGVGHSSLGYLTRFPVVDAVKIDRSFVSRLPGRRSAAIVTAMTTLAHAFGLVVVGEGVETHEQLDELRGCGCDAVQGFLVSEPVEAHQIPLLPRVDPLLRESAHRARAGRPESA